MAVLPASTQLTPPQAPARRRTYTLALLGAAALLVLVFIPPVSSEARRYEFVEAIQFSLVAFGVPALFVVGRPFALLEGRPGWRGRSYGALSRLAVGRRRHPAVARSFGFGGLFVVVTIAWRTPALVNALERHPWLLVVEVATLAVSGVLLWLEILACPPLAPRPPRPWRAVTATLAMWLIWVMDYSVGFSAASWYHAFHHAGTLSAASDQELATGILWVLSISTFLPLIMGDTMAWLKHSDDPDAELRRLVKTERRAGGTSR